VPSFPKQPIKFYTLDKIISGVHSSAYRTLSIQSCVIRPLENLWVLNFKNSAIIFKSHFTHKTLIAQNCSKSILKLESLLIYLIINLTKDIDGYRPK